MTDRTCSKCGECKPATADYFRRKSSAKSGLTARCRVCLAEIDSARYREDPDKSRVYSAANAEQIRERKAREHIVYMQTERGREVRRRAVAKYMKSPKGLLVGRLAMARRRARLAGVRNDLTATDWLGLLSLFDDACSYCGSGGDLTQDHVRPVSKGGPNTRSNVVPACMPCNGRKSDADAESWFRLQPSFTEDRWAAILTHTMALAR